MTTETPESTYVPLVRVKDLDDDTNNTINGLLGQLNRKARRNAMRARRYEAKHKVRVLASVLPDEYRKYAMVLGWSGRAVDALARRCKLTEFTHADGADALTDLGGAQLWRDNAFGSEVSQAITSSLIHATAIATTVAGDVDEREPEVLIQFHDALSATGNWNTRRHALDAAVVVNDRDTLKAPTSITLHEYGVITTIRSDGGKWEVADRHEHDYGMTADALRYRARLGRPFGSSRITRPMMSIQDMAIRSLLRLEGHQDIYSWPELWLLGAGMDVFGADADKFRVMMGRIKAIPDDETLENPRATVQQFTASSPEPHLAHINAAAKLFAREASLPDSSMAITDLANPTSADAYDSSQYELIAEAEDATDGWAPDLERTYARGLAMLNGDPDLNVPIRAKWRNPRFLSRAAQADAGLKQIQAVPDLANTDVGLELLGLEQHQIDRVLGERRRNRAAQSLESLTAGLVTIDADGTATV